MNLLLPLTKRNQRLTFLTNLTRLHDRRTDATYILHINDSTKPLLERLCFCFPEFLLELIKNDFQMILDFRLTSKILNCFASTKNKYYPCNPLVEKATVSLQYEHLHPNINSSAEEILNFVPENMELQIITASTAIDLMYLTSTLNLKNQLKIIFRIRTIDALNQLQSLFSNNLDPIFLSKLKILDFSELSTDSNNIHAFNTVLATISQKLDVLTSLTTIVIREVPAAVTLQFPEPLNSKIIIFKLNEDKGWFTLENAAKGLVAGLGVYSFYRHWFPKESSKEEKK